MSRAWPGEVCVREVPISAVEDADIFALASRIRSELGGMSIRGGRIALRAPTAPGEEGLLQLAKQNKDGLKEFLENPKFSGEWAPGQAQNAHWFGNVIAPEGNDANLGLVVRVASFPDHVWSAALELVTRRHPLLRTTYRTVSGQPRAVTSDVSAVDLVVTRADVVENTWMEEVVDRPFSLENSVGRLEILRGVEGADDLVALVIHHIAADYKGLEIVARDIFNALAMGDVPSRSIQAHYTDFVAEQAWRRSQDDYEKRLSRTAERLEGYPHRVELGIQSSPRPSTRSTEGLVVRGQVLGDAAARVRDLAQTHRTTAYTVAFEAVTRTLLRYTATPGMLVGCPMSNRDEAEWSDIVGDFVNTVPVPVDQSTEPIGERLRLAHEKLRDASADRDLSFTDVVRELRAERYPDAPPLCQIVFAWHQRMSLEDQGHGPLRSIVLSEQRGAPVDLLVVVADQDDSFEVRLHAAAGLYSTERLEALLQDILRAFEGQDSMELLESVRSGPQVSVPVRTIAQAFWEQEVARPDEVAYDGDGGTYTYREFAELVRHIAATLRAIDPMGSRIALLVHRGPGLLAAEVAVSWVGAHFVPLDPQHPIPRLQSIVDDCQPAVLLTDQDSAGLRGDFVRVRLADVAPPDEDLSGADLLQPVAVAPDSAAYVIYTSGTTNRPKGVEVPVSALANFVAQMERAMQLCPEERIAAFAPYSFDASIFELLVPLAVGATVVMADETTTRDGAALVDFINRYKVSLFSATPAGFGLMLTAGWKEPVAARAISMGDKLDAPRATQVAPLVNELWNLYGPTEATVWCTAHRFHAEAQPDHHLVPIGEPLPNAGVVILDADGRPVPDGIVGELCVLGDGLASGYLNLTELTESSFRSLGGVHYYRTGDRARLLDGGEITVLGRFDHQVKVRGHRIELLEIEGALRKHPDVTDACVVKQVRASEEVLVAFVDAVDSADTGQLRAHLETYLPRYMVPARIMRMHPLPTTTNGKVDRDQLAGMSLWDANAADGPALAEEPDGPVKDVTALWRSVLGHSDFGSNDNFFSVGGTSLQALRLCELLSASSETPVAVAEVFTWPTVREQAQLVTRTGAAPVPRKASPRDLPQSFPGRVASVERGPVRHVVLTGATGFLGAHVAADLAAAGVRVTCLVRGDHTDHAQRRLDQALARWQITLPANADVTAVPADLSTPGLGVEEDLLKDVDAIVHSAAHVNLVLPYDALERTNVDATVELLAMAARYGGIPFHFVSTYSVVDPSQDWHPEEWGAPEHPWLAIPYVRTKWQSERLLDQARRRGSQVAVYRPSRIVGHSRTGATNPDDLFNLALGCVRAMGSAPDIPTMDNFVTVDQVSQSLVGHVVTGSGIGHVHHLVHPHWRPWTSFVESLRATGSVVDTVPYKAWMETFRSFAGTATGSRYAVLHAFMRQYADAFLGLGAHHPVLDDRKAKSRGLSTGAEPPFDTDYMSRTLRYIDEHLS